MSKNFFLFLFFLCFVSCNSKDEFFIEKIKESDPIYTEQKYEFPLLKGANKISEKVNHHLIKDLLDLDNQKSYHSIFENIWTSKKNKNSRLSFLKYNINILNNILYSVTFETEGCGAYCEEYSVSYNYDLSNGNIIKLDSIFTKVSEKEFLKVLSDYKRNLIEKEIQKMKNEYVSKKDKEIIRESIQLYEYCLEGLPFKEMEYLDFKIEKDSIIIESDRCSNHAMRALDDLGDYRYPFHKVELKPYLNAYGKTLLITKD